MKTRRPIALLLMLLTFAAPEPARAQSQPGRTRKPPRAATVPEAKAHRKFRAGLRVAKKADELETLLAEIEKALPRSTTPGPTNPPLPPAAYDRDPEAEYQASDPDRRAFLDRQLWADAAEQALDAQLEANPVEYPALADRARKILPDRPKVADRLLVQGLEAAAKDVAALRRDDVERLANQYRKGGDAAGEQKARALFRRWLDHRREHLLGPTDAEARILLASQYQAMLSDSTAAAKLLLEAVGIDPGAEKAANALVNLGYKKAGDRWFAPGQAPDAPKEPTASPSTAEPPKVEPAGSLVGMTREAVRRKLGKPDHSARCASQGQVVEQWTYRGDRGTQYVNFARRGRGEPTVIFQGALP